MKNKLVCKICGFEGIALIKHINCKHNLSGQDYKKLYSVDKLLITSDETKKKLSNSIKTHFKSVINRKKNSEVQKNGASIFTIKYWINKGFTEIDAKNKVSEIQRKNSEKSVLKGNFKERSYLCAEYWIKKGKTKKEAVEIIRQQQSVYSSKSAKFKGHSQTDEGKKKISDSMKKLINEIGPIKWADHFGKFDGTSKIEIEFYNYIKENIDSSVESNVIIGLHIVDVLRCEDKKIIEFYGDYWHCNPIKYNAFDEVKFVKNKKNKAKDVWEKDSIRSLHLKNLGYTMLVIWESDWNNKKEECIKQIKEFLL